MNCMGKSIYTESLRLEKNCKIQPLNMLSVATKLLENHRLNRPLSIACIIKSMQQYKLQSTLTIAKALQFALLKNLVAIVILQD